MGKSDKNSGKIIIISGPSGVGKSTICRGLTQREDIIVSVSETTRPKGEKEVDGQDYRFISKEQFEERKESDGFLEYAEVFDNFYGTPRDQVEKAIGLGKTVILEIDVQGALQVKQSYPDAVMIFILPPTQADLANRMTGRARGEDDEIAKKRLNNAGAEIAVAWQHYDHMVINADVQQAIEEIRQIIDNDAGEKND